MFTTVVVPYDGTEFAATAIPPALVIARPTGASLCLVGVAHSDSELWWVADRVRDRARQVPATAVAAIGIDVIVDPDPATVLLEVADDGDNVLCCATHDRVAPAATLLRSVGSELIERARHPFVAVGRGADHRPDGSDVVVALDGVHPWPLLATAADWARQLEAASAPMSRLEHCETSCATSACRFSSSPHHYEADELSPRSERRKVG